jgi:hypothetical protein
MKKALLATSLILVPLGTQAQMIGIGDGGDTGVSQLALSAPSYLVFFRLGWHDYLDSRDEYHQILCRDVEETRVRSAGSTCICDWP